MLFRSIWKAHDYEEAIDKAYQLGMQDAKTDINENVHGASYTGIETTPSTSAKREKGESNENLLKRLYTNAVRTKRGTPG